MQGFCLTAAFFGRKIGLLRCRIFSAREERGILKISERKFCDSERRYQMKEYKWATLGCGVIANQFAQALAANGRKLYSVANRTHEKAVAFAAQYGIEKVYDRVEDVFWTRMWISSISLPRITPIFPTFGKH